MRATSPPPALPVATAACALVAAVLAPLAAPSSALAERWLRPVAGEVARSFAYARGAPFARGAHRGVDLSAPPGTAVRAGCSGRVIQAGPVAGRDDVVSTRCGTRRVSYLPLARVAVREGATIRAGDAIGAVAPGHGGLHLGVRREADPFGYEDPLALLAPARRSPPALPDRFPRTRAPRGSVRVPRVAGPGGQVLSPAPPVADPAGPRRRSPAAQPAETLARRGSAVAARPALPHPPLLNAPAPDAQRRAAGERSTTAQARPAPTAPPTRHAVPWPVWAGLALTLSGAAGSTSIALRH